MFRCCPTAYWWWGCGVENWIVVAVSMDTLPASGGVFFNAIFFGFVVFVSV